MSNRLPIPKRTRLWVERSLGEGARIVSARRLRGGLSSLVHLLDVAYPDARDGKPTGFILKRPVLENDDTPGNPSHEITAEARILERLSGPRSGKGHANRLRPFNWAPRLVAVDRHGEESGSPAILQMLLPGQPQVAPSGASQLPQARNIEAPRNAKPNSQIHEPAHVAQPASGRTPLPAGSHSASASPSAFLATIPSSNPTTISLADWLQGLAGATHVVAESGVRSDDLEPFAPWLPSADEPPTWCSAPKTFAALYEDLARGWLPNCTSPQRFIHRDLHPANELFSGASFSGIVDFVHGCQGPVEADISRCRVEIAILAGMEAADHYLALCTDLLPTYDYRWDSLVALELSPWAEDLVECFNSIGARLTKRSVHATLNHFLHPTTAANPGD